VWQTDRQTELRWLRPATAVAAVARKNYSKYGTAVLTFRFCFSFFLSNFTFSQRLKHFCKCSDRCEMKQKKLLQMLLDWMRVLHLHVTMTLMWQQRKNWCVVVGGNDDMAENGGKNPILPRRQRLTGRKQLKDQTRFRLLVACLVAGQWRHGRGREGGGNCLSSKIVGFILLENFRSSVPNLGLKSLHCRII